MFRELNLLGFGTSRCELIKAERIVSPMEKTEEQQYEADGLAEVV